MGRRWLLAGLAWLVTAALTTAVAIGAVNSLRRGIFGPADAPPMSEAEVQARLSPSAPDGGSPAATQGPTPAPSSSGGVPSGGVPSGGVPSSPAAPPSGGAPKALPTDGGTIVAVCDGNGLARLVSWTPRPGWEADHVVAGPAPAASLRFKARSGGGDVRALITCAGDQPTLALTGDD
ncbi:hypothetical protein ACFFX1_02500 [Dactylosporangium sucinum]|uniref:Uncharacterized protein n=1 Tax=Dactylosporangium sucinum TaxID=1424081 RepID=A0A917WII7_9ACTN|nr:hypothetical protein [Dactylosporangium sucinum]GGM07580.1 hypothetical protein GCM10007977_005790 [Dactylosporangium sucinum]